MGNTAVVAILVLTALGQVRGPSRSPYRPSEYSGRSGGTVSASELKRQQEEFKTLWGKEMTLKLDDLPASAAVPEFRIPYSGHDYPDYGGGTLAVMSKYDQAFHGGQGRAAGYERRDLDAHRAVKEPTGRGLFFRRPQTPGWYGHCNGWTAAAIRHAEPQASVTRNGVVFSPADIKGLLAELYMYSNTAILDGTDRLVNPATLHLVLGNWVGLGKHSIGMETAPGKVVINFPIYGYKSNIRKLSSQQVDVQTTIDYTLHIHREVDKSPKNPRQLYFHYSLYLDDQGRIVGGQYHGDSAVVDMLWVPLKPTPGGQKGNERGNPYLDVKEVLAIWRESVPAEVRGKWLNVDAPDEDRLQLADDAKPLEKTAETTAESPTEERKSEEKTETGGPSVAPANGTPPTPEAKPADSPPSTESP